MKDPRLGLIGLFSANAVSALGTAMSLLAVPWFVLAMTGSPVDTGLAALAEMLPYVLAQGLGGPLVDGLGARRLSVLTDLVAALGMGALPLVGMTAPPHAGATGSLDLPLICAFLVVVGAARGGGDIARRVLLPELAGPASMPLDRASGLYDGINRASNLAGAPLAGLLMLMTSAPLVLAADAASFASSALIVGLLCRGRKLGEPRAFRESRRGRRRGPSYLAELREGFARVSRDRLLLGIGAMIVATNFLDQAYGAVLLPSWAKSELGSPLSLGILSALFGLGAVSGNALMAWLSPRLPRRMPFAIGFFLCGAPRFLVLASSSSLLPAAAVSLVAGLGAGGLNPALGAVEYERVPSPFRARVLGALGAMAWAGIPFGGLAGGLLAETLGLENTLWIFGVAYLLATLSPFVFPVWREMDGGGAEAERAAEA